MLVLLSKIALGLSATGIILMLTKKAPALAELPETPTLTWSGAFKKRAERVAPDFSGFSFEKFLQRILSKTKIFILKAEHKINGQLRKIRRKNKAKKKDFGNDEYWDELKNEVDDDSN